jgi:glutathione synthase/RimK-type ligase-like ATP-grasp enzyme
MKKIGVLFGVENSFPSALMEAINARNVEGIQAEFVQTGAVNMEDAPRYAVIIDRISHQVPFYRALLKHAALHGTVVLNNPLWSSTDDKFLDCVLAARLGIPVPPTVILPHKQLPGDTTERSMRNLEYPLDWDAVFAYVGEHGFLKPINGRGWQDVHEVHGRDEFFRAYDASRDLCMIYQRAVDYTEYYRCFVVGQKKVRVMAYDPRRPHEDRYVKDAPSPKAKLLRQIEQASVKLCQALGYDINTVEFAVEKGIPYAIDFMNPVPDAEMSSVGKDNFEWMVNEVAGLAIAKAKAAPVPLEPRWAALLAAQPAAAKPSKAKPAKAAAKPKPSAKKPSAPKKSTAQKLFLIVPCPAIPAKSGFERAATSSLIAQAAAVQPQKTDPSSSHKDPQYPSPRTTSRILPALSSSPDSSSTVIGIGSGASIPLRLTMRGRLKQISSMPRNPRSKPLTGSTRRSS